jgi:glutamine synthetase adenylyltransferase
LTLDNKFVFRTAELQKRLEELKPRLKKRREALEELLRFYDFLFEVENELQWVREKRAVLEGDNLPNDLVSALSSFKKSKKNREEIAIHEEGSYAKVLASGNALVAAKHPERAKVHIYEGATASWTVGARWTLRSWSLARP